MTGGALLSWSAEDDGPILVGLLAQFCRVPSPVVVDATANAGVMWTGTGIVPIRCDTDPAQAPDHVTDCRALPFPAGSVDVLVFDPPHIPGKGTRHTLPGYAARYGLGTLDASGPDAIPALFVPFLAEAVRVVRRGGLVLAKLSSPVYWDRRRWYVHQFWAAVTATPGLRYEDEQIKVRAVPMPQDARPAQHLRSAHSVWAVVRRVRR